MRVDWDGSSTWQRWTEGWDAGAEGTQPDSLTSTLADSQTGSVEMTLSSGHSWDLDKESAWKDAAGDSWRRPIYVLFPTRPGEPSEGPRSSWEAAPSGARPEDHWAGEDGSWVLAEPLHPEIRNIQFLAAPHHNSAQVTLPWDIKFRGCRSVRHLGLYATKDKDVAHLLWNVCPLLDNGRRRTWVYRGLSLCVGGDYNSRRIHESVALSSISCRLQWRICYKQDHSADSVPGGKPTLFAFGRAPADDPLIICTRPVWESGMLEIDVPWVLAVSDRPMRRFSVWANRDCTLKELFHMLLRERETLYDDDLLGCARPGSDQVVPHVP